MQVLLYIQQYLAAGKWHEIVLRMSLKLFLICTEYAFSGLNTFSPPPPPSPPPPYPSPPPSPSPSPFPFPFPPIFLITSYYTYISALISFYFFHFYSTYCQSISLLLLKYTVHQLLTRSFHTSSSFFDFFCIHFVLILFVSNVKFSTDVYSYYFFKKQILSF